MTHLKITQSGLIAAFTTIIGQVVALVPAWAPEKADLIQGGSFAISAAFLLANSFHHIADTHGVNLDEIEQHAVQAAASTISKVDFNGLVAQAVQAHGVTDLEQLAEQKVQQALQRALASVPVAPAPAAVTDAARVGYEQHGPTGS